MVQLRHKLWVSQLALIGMLSLTGCIQNSSVGKFSSDSTVTTAPSESSQTSTSPSATPVSQVDSYLVHLYRTTFYRAPDTTGYNFWVSAYNNGFNCMSIARGFLEASENTLRTQLLLQPTNQTLMNQYVVKIYLVLLDRTPTQSDLNYYVSLLQNGSAVSDVEGQVMASAEFETVCQNFGIQ